MARCERNGKQKETQAFYRGGSRKDHGSRPARGASAISRGSGPQEKANREAQADNADTTGRALTFGTLERSALKSSGYRYGVVSHVTLAVMVPVMSAPDDVWLLALELVVTVAEISVLPQASPVAVINPCRTHGDHLWGAGDPLNLGWLCLW